MQILKNNSPPIETFGTMTSYFHPVILGWKGERNACWWTDIFGNSKDGFIFRADLKPIIDCLQKELKEKGNK